MPCAEVFPREGVRIIDPGEGVLAHEVERHLGDDGLHKGGLAAEMFEQRTLGGAGRRRNLARRRCLGTALGEQRYRGAQDRRADRRGGFAAGLRASAFARFGHRYVQYVLQSLYISAERMYRR